MSSSAEEAGSQSVRMSVVDCSTSIAGRFAASVLAGRGARVVRPLPPAIPQDPTALFTSRGVEVIPEPRSGEEWEAILAPADVVLVSAGHGQWGDIEGLANQHTRLSIVSVTPYGLLESEPRKATALTLAAESGLLGITGEPNGPPEPIRGHVTEFACGWAISSAAWAAYRQAKITGKGSKVDLALLEMFVFLQWNATQRAAFEGVTMQRQGARGLGHPWGIYPCKDGHVILIVGAGGRNWARFADLMGVPELSDERYQSAQARAQHADEIDALMLPWLMDHTSEEIFTLAQDANLPFGMVRRPGDLVSDVQLQARNFFTSGPDGLTWPEMPFRINGVRPAWAPPAALAGGAK
jgi:crotonobetainyl-CoA:carnitine CoA-transferase CaiB-like acyl-CoA transferase